MNTMNYISSDESKSIGLQKPHKKATCPSG